MKQDNRLKKFIGKRLVIIGKKHPHFETVGTGKAFEETQAAFGLLINLDSGESCFVFDKSEVKLLFDEKEEDMTLEEIIEHLAGCNYGPRTIAKYLELDETKFMRQWNDKRSKTRFHYDKGQLSAEFDINKKNLQNAKSGNITAAQIYFKQADVTKIENLKAKLFDGFDEITDEPLKLQQ